ncbi:MAG: hypothetical protein ACRDZ8_15180 [Acidimicrobiales bacterium]
MAFWVAVAAALAAAFFVFRRLGAKPLWLDESVSVSVAGRPWIRILEVLTHHDGNAGLYYLTLHAWMHFGGGAAWDRAPGAAFFVATVALAALAGARWRGAWFGALCGMLVATNQFLLFYGQEARPYSLAALLALASTVALFARRGNPAPGWYLAFTVLLLYADLFAVLFVIAQALALVLLSRYRREKLSPALVRCWAVIAIGGAPLAMLMMVRERAQISWLPRPTVAQLGDTFLSMTNGWAGLVLLLTLGGLSLRWARGHGRGAWDQRVVPVLACALVVPPVALWTFAQAVPSFLDRYVITSTVAALGLGAIWLHELRRLAGPVVAAVVAAALAVLGFSGIVAAEAQPYKYENVPAVVGFVAARSRPGDAIGFDGGGLRTAIDAYLPAPPGGRGHLAAFPVDVALAAGGDAFLQRDLYAREVAPELLAERLKKVRRVWMITDPSSGIYPTIGAFTNLRIPFLAEFSKAGTNFFPGIDVTLYTQVGP